ncbi:MFS transporter [Streptomyces sp. NBC_01622]|uniref:MFS transporter n=1 Tax=Streptomyces sp. NBC_01622 TaxID=2975903 RepID=UPI00386C8D8A|nr:MFS transporter [Streptomyces sp. NBC_01622]
MTAAAETTAQVSAARALGHNRDFRLLWIGQATSELGSSISMLALPMLVLVLSGSAALAGLLGTVAFLAAWLGQLPGGYIADMFDRRRVMLLCDLGRAVLTGLAVVAVVTSTAPATVLLVVVGVSMFLWMAFAAAQTQAIRMIVPAEQIPEAVGVNQARGYAVDMVGPLLAGWLFTIDHAAPLVVDAVTFVVSLVCVWLLRTALKAESRPTMRRLLPDVGRGWSVLWRHPFLRAMTVYAMVTNFAVSMLLFVLILGSAGGVLVGAGISVAAAAGLLGSLLAPQVSRRVPMRPLLVTAALLRAGSMVLAATLGSGTALVAVLAGVLLLGPMVGAALTSAQMLLVPGDVLGRVRGASGFLSSALQPLAPLAAGFLVQYLDRTAAQFVLVGAFVAVAVVAAVMPGFSRRTMSELPTARARPS